jgi:hypothetical protein
LPLSFKLIKQNILINLKKNETSSKLFLNEKYTNIVLTPDHRLGMDRCVISVKKLSHVPMMENLLCKWNGMVSLF